MNAVVGLKAEVDEQSHHAPGSNLRAVSFDRRCSTCPTGKRLDGWPNRISMSARSFRYRRTDGRSEEGLHIVPGNDPRYNQDGKNNPLVIPPAYGLAHVKNETYTAEGPISYWNAYVAVTQMGGQGNFKDERLKIDVKHAPDLVTDKLPALRAYQHSLPAPHADASSYDATAAQRGRVTFNRTCATCHVGGNGTDNDSGKLHSPAETGLDGAYAMRTANKSLRTPPLRGLQTHPPYFHDGSAKTLGDVVQHYNSRKSLELTQDQQVDLVEYLKSL
jgi:mono/diheme cytochrome c family protein